MDDRTDRYGLRKGREPGLVPDFVRAIPPCEDGSLAVYDADGTLWTNDVADDFTQWMIERGAIPGERWPTYMRIYRDHPPTGCRYLLTFYSGMMVPELHALIDEYWDEHADRAWVWEVIESLYHLRDKGYPLWIVSGTPTDFLLPLKRILSVDEIVGMDFHLDEAGWISGTNAGIPCAGEGKARKLEQLAAGRPVRFCAGNGSLDGPMMELAEVAWSVYPNPEFAEHSRARGWPILPRPPDFVEEEKFVLEE